MTGPFAPMNLIENLGVIAFATLVITALMAGALAWVLLRLRKQ